MRRVRPEIVLVALLVAGAALRIWLTLQWRPAFLGLPDSAGFIQAADLGVFTIPLRPAGYPIALGALRLVHDGLGAIATLQHVLGLATAVLLFAAMVRLGFSRWVAVAPAGVVALHGAWTWLEHSVLAESLFLALVALALFCAAGRSPAWFAAAGAAVAAATAVRTTGIVLVPILIAFCAWTASGSRLRAALAAAAPAVGVLAAYLVAAHATYGTWSFARNDAFQSYGRVATFADCRVFTPPRGAEPLCPPMDARERLGHDWWLYTAASPAVIAYGHPSTSLPRPEQLSAMNGFVRKAVLSQPKAYARTVARDLVRLVDPAFPQSTNPAIANASAGYTPDDLVRGLKDPSGEQFSLDAQPGTATHHAGMGGLESYERATRLTGIPMALLLLLALAAPFAVARERRPAAALLAAAAYALLVFPILTSSYDWRYVVPALPLLAGAAAAGAAGLAARTRARR